MDTGRPSQFRFGRRLSHRADGCVRRRSGTGRARPFGDGGFRRVRAPAPDTVATDPSQRSTSLRAAKCIHVLNNMSVSRGEMSMRYGRRFAFVVAVISGLPLPPPCPFAQPLVDVSRLPINPPVTTATARPGLPQGEVQMVVRLTDPPLAAVLGPNAKR